MIKTLTPNQNQSCYNDLENLKWQTVKESYGRVEMGECILVLLRNIQEIIDIEWMSYLHVVFLLYLKKTDPSLINK